MKIVLQKVKEASVSVNNKNIAKIFRGILVFLCVEKSDRRENADYLMEKLINLRIFEDANEKMNLSIQDVKGEFLVVSEFTLAGNCNNGRRPSFENAASPKEAEELYNYFVKKLKENSLKVESGIFRAMMDVHIVNEGPVTFLLESKNNI